MCCFQQILSGIYPHHHTSQDTWITHRRLCRKIKYNPKYFTVKGRAGDDTGMHYHKHLCPLYINIQLSTHQHSAEQDIKLSRAEEPSPSTSSVELPWNKGRQMDCPESQRAWHKLQGSGEAIAPTHSTHFNTMVTTPCPQQGHSHHLPLTYGHHMLPAPGVSKVRWSRTGSCL